MNTLDAWTDRVARELGLDPSALDRTLLLDLTKDVAHGVARPAAPLTAFLVGLAAGRDGGGTEQIRAACDTVSRLASEWSTGTDDAE